MLFSIADNKRSIPSMVDGLKPGQRKILYGCFIKNDLKSQIKVAQVWGISDTVIARMSSVTFECDFILFDLL